MDMYQKRKMRQEKVKNENKEDLELLHDPMAGIAEEIANAEENA